MFNCNFLSIAAKSFLFTLVIIVFVEPVPSHSDGVHRSSPPRCSSSRMETGQRLVVRMPSNPRTMTFISTQERFDVPLCPELWPAFAAGSVPASDLQQHTNTPAHQQSNINTRGRSNSVGRQGNPLGVDGGSNVRKRRVPHIALQGEGNLYLISRHD